MTKSKRLFNDATSIIPSGVNSPVRYFKPYPFFVKRSYGGNLWDVDGNQYVDFCNGYGSLLLGHKRREIISAVSKQLGRGTMFGTPTDIEIKLSKLIQRHFPSMKKIRLVNTGGEATMTAIRLARGFTKKNKIIKFDGCYHGAHDSVLVKSGSGHAHIGIPVSLGIPNDTTKNTLVVPYNDLDALEKIITKYDDIACVIMEPVIANMGLILPKKSFLSQVRKLTKEHNIILIFDEIVSGFRFPGGAQKLYNVNPDLTTLGKALGNGFTIAAVGGRHEIMDNLAPMGQVYQASTFAGNPISVTAGISTLETMNKIGPSLYTKLEQECKKLVNFIDERATKLNIPHKINSIHSIFQIFFTDCTINNSSDVLKSDTSKFNQMFTQLLKQGIFIAPSQFEVSFLSYAHTSKDLSKATMAYDVALRSLV